jgi:2-polyprenyl-3-methyl-5-hydroxy-6-metoxy-1,4-benzoquinol methylase
VGCGFGVMRERIPEEAIGSYLGVDPAEEGLKIARAKEFPNSRFEVGSLPEKGSFDAIICNEMLYYPEHPEIFIPQVRRLLRSGGLLITSMTRFHGERYLLKILAQEMVQLDECIVRNEKLKRKWRVGCYRA